MKVIIAGSRTVTDFKQVLLAIGEAKFDITEVVSGTAQGVDKLGEACVEFANHLGNNVELTKFPADWKRYGKAAGPIRNRQMAEYADAAIVVHNGSKGSLNMIATMKKLGKPVHEVIVNGT